LDDEAMHCTLVVDSREAVLKESGDVILSKANIYAEAGEVFSGAKRPKVTATTVFKSVGIAAEDIAAAMLVYERAIDFPLDQREMKRTPENLLPTLLARAAKVIE
jgi:thiomorpholine-carboxylate dehydrogenase